MTDFMDLMKIISFLNSGFSDVFILIFFLRLFFRTAIIIHLMFMCLNECVCDEGVSIKHGFDRAHSAYYIL